MAIRLLQEEHLKICFTYRIPLWYCDHRCVFPQSNLVVTLGQQEMFFTGPLGRTV